MSMAWIRDYYDVPVKRGGRVRYTGRGWPELGTITGTRGASLRVLLDGHKKSLVFHPTWKLTYLDDNGTVLWP
ncbi:hypothetical protein OG563_26330 [Nocardia vinacea]|uniref:HNH endonuclease n=1 Tax=Nocardia vinacea TaxID=96468 RepID=A0ABZ1YHU4_9NOCA|nr:hypothetical protein [Nocardia vinacea]